MQLKVLRSLDSVAVHKARLLREGEQRDLDNEEDEIDNQVRDPLQRQHILQKHHRMDTGSIAFIAKGVAQCAGGDGRAS